MNKNDLPIGVGVLVVQDGKILCGIRTDNGLVCGPGGHIEKGEKPEQAARREAKEEFGILPQKLVSIGCIDSPDDGYNPTQVFLCREFEGEPDTDDEEMTFPYYASIEELQDSDLKLFPAFEDSLGLLLHKIGALTNDEKRERMKHDAGSEDLDWVTIRGQHIPLDPGTGLPVGGNPKVFGSHAHFKSGHMPIEGGGGGRSRAGQASPGIKTIKPSSDSKAFKNKLTTAKTSVSEDIRWRVDDYSHSAEDYDHCQKFISDKGSTMAVTPDGDIISVCHNENDRDCSGRDLLKKAVEAGGKKLDAFSGLFGFYRKCGFEPVSWCEFSEEYAPPGWDRNRDEKEPVIFWKYTGNYSSKTKTELDQEMADFLSKTKGRSGENGYDEAMHERDRSMEA